VNRYDDYAIFFVLSLFFILPTFLGAQVGTINSGQSLWWMTKRIGQETIPIESCVDELSFGNETVITSADISAGTITLGSSGNYCLAEDVTADFDITITGVALDLNGHCVTGEVDIGPLGAEDIIVLNGTITPPQPLGAPNPGVTINAATSRVRLVDLTVECADSSSDDAGRTAIQVQGDEAQLIRCTVKGGAVGGPRPSGNATNGGHGIELTSTSTNAIIRDCVISSGNGGTTSSSGNGGNGGDGIFVDGAVNAEIFRCLFLDIGDGGFGEGGGMHGGDGGNGVNISGTSVDISVHDCVIKTMGNQGNASGGTPGSYGTGIADAVWVDSTKWSVIFRNMVYTVPSGVTARYFLQALVPVGSGGFDAGNPPSNVINSDFENVYM